MEKKNREPSDPFYFRTQDNTLVFTSPTSWAAELEQMFVQTMKETPIHQSLLDAARRLGDPANPERFNIGIFTSGSKDQVSKVAAFLAENEIPVSQMWWTWMPKGEFAEEVVRLGIPQGENDPLGSHDHAVIMVDDSDAQLDSIKAANASIKEQTGGSFVCVRYDDTGIGSQTSGELVTLLQTARDAYMTRSRMVPEPRIEDQYPALKMAS